MFWENFICNVLNTVVTFNITSQLTTVIYTSLSLVFSDFKISYIKSFGLFVFTLCNKKKIQFKV